MEVSADMTLTEMAALPIAKRFSIIRDFRPDDLLRASGTLPLERLAWAVAFNCAGSEEPVTPASTSPMRCYLMLENSGQPADCVDAVPTKIEPSHNGWTLRRLWTLLTEPRPDTGLPTLLSELALSVSCEHRSDWQPPSARPLSVDDAMRSADRLVRCFNRAVIGHVARKFGERAGPPEEVAAEAWERVFLDYWSAWARKRFLGLSLISTFVCGIATYVAIDCIRKARMAGDPPEVESFDGAILVRPGSGVPTEEITREVLSGHRGIDARLAVTDPVDAGLVRQELMERLPPALSICLKELTPKQRQVWDLCFGQGLTGVDAARCVGVTKEAVSQRLQGARQRLAECLSRHGQDLSAIPESREVFFAKDA